MATNIELLKEDIATMQEVMDDSSTPQNVKDAMKQPLMEAKKQLAEMESDKGSKVVKSKMTVSKTGKLEKPKSEKKGLSALQKCQELLAKYTNEKKTAQERIDKRKASGKPAELTPAETIAKASKLVGSKIKDIKESDKKLTDTEVKKIISGIESTILNTISAIVEMKDRQKFINELIDYLEKLAINTDEELKNLLGWQYVEFVKILGENIKDEKFRKALRRIGEKTTVKTSLIGKKAIDMIPTQSEIDVDKSLKRPLQSPDDVRKYFTEKTPIKLSGNSVVTCSNGNYIIDGHHRWSQVYMINPQAELSCLDLTDLKTPFDGLKASQLGIAADLGEVPTKPVKGTNLITISESELKEYVNKHITEDVINVLKEFGVTKPAEFIWNNTKLMQQKNKPVLNAPVRDFMPQTDDAKNWQDYVPNVSKIESTNFRDGGKVEEHNIDMLHNLGVQIKHHSYELMKNIHKNDDVEAWVVAKAERAATDLSDISHYLEGEKKKFDNGGYVNKMNSVLVKFANPQYNYVTSINGSEDSARKYFVGKYFNVGSFPKEDFQKVIDIEFHPASKSFANGGELDWGKELSGGYTVGEDIIVIDPSYREFYNKTGYIVDEVGSNFVIIVDRNGEDYRLILPKRSVKRLDMTNLYRYGAMAKGGVVYPNLSDMRPSVVNDAPTYEQLYKKKGQLEIGEYAIQEVDLVKVGNKILSHDLVKSPQSAVEIFRKFWNKNSIVIRESAYAMFLNRANEVIAIYEVGKGGVTGVVMDPELIASVAVKSLARGVIIAHNHPSGNLTPSPQDKQMTNKIKEGLKFLDIQLLDHFIITENSYFSFADEGIL